MKSALLIVAFFTLFLNMATAKTLHLASCDHEVILRQSSMTKPEISGATDRTNLPANVSLEITPDGARFVCNPSNRVSTSTSRDSASVIVSGVRINRAIGPRATAEQNMGGKIQQAKSGANSISLVITVPSGWRIQARSWIGSLRADTGIWQADVEITAGEMSFASLKDSTVVVDAGSITAQSLHGRFTAHVRGAGDIEVVRSNDAELDLQLTGVGSMSFKGRAKTAVIRASGIGSIEIEKVATAPKVTSSSLATIDIGR